MGRERSPSEQRAYAAVGRAVAARVSRDAQVIGEAADVAVMKLAAHWEHVSDTEARRKAWVGVVARNHAMRLGRRLARDRKLVDVANRPNDDAGTEEFEMVGLLITEMRSGHGMRFSSLAADRMDFEHAWALMSGEDRSLLHAKYVEGMTSKQIARELRLTPGTVDNKLTAAKRSAALVFAGLLGSFDRDARWESA